MFFQTDTEGAFCGKSAVDYSGDECVFDATVKDRVFSLSVGTAGLVMMLTLSVFVFFSVTKLEFCFVLFKDGSVTLLNNAMFSFVLVG